ncbi:hypothetical protein HZH66_010417 [Vespula vulgaris]|uniref:Uncharacterized protein n=1 Tax=Vespula vulgaris TaxID=7454 RepID=A0A834MXU2_VESVU|nr:hypothetical protein HZH66_010417 [Vespula vulgaris]
MLERNPTYFIKVGQLQGPRTREPGHDIPLPFQLHRSSARTRATPPPAAAAAAATAATPPPPPTIFLGGEEEAFWGGTRTLADGSGGGSGGDDNGGGSTGGGNTSGGGSGSNSSSSSSSSSSEDGGGGGAVVGAAGAATAAAGAAGAFRTAPPPSGYFRRAWTWMIIKNMLCGQRCLERIPYVNPIYFLRDLTQFSSKAAHIDKFNYRDISSPLLTIVLPDNTIITNINLQGTLYHEVSRRPYFRENFLDVFGGTHVRALADNDINAKTSLSGNVVDQRAMRADSFDLPSSSSSLGNPCLFKRP